MDGEAILEVLREIRDEARQTNHRLASLEGRVDQTNQRLASLEGRVGFLEQRTAKGFEDLNGHLAAHVERIEALTRRQTDSELRLATEVLSLADVTRQVRDLISKKLDDHARVTDHEERIRAIEHRIADGPSKD